jgi:hypothetical protein
MTPEDYAAEAKRNAASSPDKQFIPEPPRAASAPPTPPNDPGFRFPGGGGFGGWLNEAGFRLPSWRRILLTLAVVVAGAVVLSPVGAAICGGFMAAAATMTASAFLINAAWWIGALLSVYFGSKLLLKAAAYFLSYKVDRDLADTRNAVAWAFTADPKPRP